MFPKIMKMKSDQILLPFDLFPGKLYIILEIVKEKPKFYTVLSETGETCELFKTRFEKI
jgi:hypothetical protein